jgi:hypothetical protein
MKNIVYLKNDVWNELINEGLALKVKPKIK